MLKVIAKLGSIPLGSTVTKIRGCVEYTVRDRVTFYSDGGDNQEILAREGCVFLVGTNGLVNAFGEGKEVVWYTSLDQLNEIHDDTVAK